MSDPNFSAIRARLKYASIDAFIDGYSRFISSGGMFIPMAPEKLKPIGTTIRFQFLLNDGTTALLGEGTVLQVRPPDDSKPNAPVGMLVKFAKLSQESKQLVDRIVSEKEGAKADEPQEEAAAQKDPTAASDDPTGEYTQDELARMAADEAPERGDEEEAVFDPPTREAPSAAELEDDEDEIALELERVDEEVRKEGGPKRLAGTDGGISVFAFDNMSDEDMKDFENFSFGGDEDEIDSMFDGLFGGGGDDDGGLFGGGDDGGLFGDGDDDGGFFGDESDDDEPIELEADDDAAEDVADEPAAEVLPESDDLEEENDDLFVDADADDLFDDEDVAVADAAVEEPADLLADDASDGEEAIPLEEEYDAQETAEDEFLSEEDEDDDVDLDFPEFGETADADVPDGDIPAGEIPAGAVDEDDDSFEDFDEPVDEAVEPEDDEDDAFLQEDDEIAFPTAEDEESVVELHSDVSFVEEIVDDSEPEVAAAPALPGEGAEDQDEDEDVETADSATHEGSGVYELIGSLDDDEEEELSLNIGHGALAQSEEEPEPEEPEDEESLEALLASAQKEIESKRSDEEEEKPEGDIIDQILGDDDDLPPPPPDMPAFQLPDGNSKKKKGGFISKLFGKD